MADSWHVLVEETIGSGEAQRWGLEFIGKAHEHQEDARAEAAELARTFQPRHPFTVRQRRAFWISDDSWLVVVKGMTTRFHLRITVAALMEK